jgi:uncharacterized protein YjbI with pentapeptide repeats
MAEDKDLILVLFTLFLIVPSKVTGEQDAMDVILADQIRAMIIEGEYVDFSNVIVEGKLDFCFQGRDNFCYANSSIRIRNSIFSDGIDFSGTIFRKPVSFERTSFEGPANFQQTQFEQGADFIGSKFNNVSFRDATLSGHSEFRNSLFKGTANFFNASFRNGAANFEGARFNGPARFLGTYFDVDSSNFGWSLFNGPSSFWDADFIGESSFKGAKFNQTADFTLVRFDGPADLIGSRFEKELYFNDVKFSVLKVSWDSLKDRMVCNGPAYLSLIKNFKDQEQFEDADNCYYQYREWKRQQRPFGWSKLIDYLALVSCGYGVRWQNTMLMGIGVMVFFALYFSAKRGILSSKGSNQFQKLKESLFFSLTILLSAPTDWYVNLFGIDNYRDIVKANKYSIFLERVIGWSLLILLINTLSRVMIRY